MGITTSGIPFDDRNYTVTAINGFRRGSLTRSEAERLARTMRETMRTSGWAGRVRVFFRDGSEVKVS